MALLVTGCGKRDPIDVLGVSEAGTIVVDAVLMVGEPLPAIRLSRTTDPDRPYSIRTSALTGAAVQIRNGARVFPYREVTTLPGFYVQTAPLSETVKPETLYELQVLTQESETVTAQTLTPPVLDVDRWVVLENDGTTVREDLVKFGEGNPYNENRLTHGDGLIEARFTRPDVPAFQGAIFSLDENSDFAIDVSFLDEDDLDEFTRENTSPMLLNEDGTFRLPWFAVAFEREYRFEIYATDRNWYDLVRSFPDLNGGGGFGFGRNTGDNFEKPFFHIEGGIGLFGSASVDSIGFCVNCPDNTE